jgi:predicted N-acetyltransferase YhbS
MAVQMTSVLPEHVDEVGQVVYEAFKEIAERHNYEPAFSVPELATGIVRLLVQAEGYQSYLLLEDGKAVACNFGDERDDVVGVGPVAVAVKKQGNGYGRRVMEALLERAEANGVRSVRLTQAAYNRQSFSLYHNLGFDTRDVLANVRGRIEADERPVDSVRTFTADDASACDALHREVLGFGRRGDIEYMATMAAPLVVERNGAIAGYATRFPGGETFVTHAAARDESALKDLLIGMQGVSEGPLHLLLPSRHAGTLRWLMGQGFEVMELDCYMVRGEYQEPLGAWLPSPFY